MKKNKGSIVDVFASVLGILACFISLFCFLMVVDVANYKEDVKSLARGYLLEVETVGYLPPEGVTAFRHELTDIGVTNIDFTGTTISPVNYGQSIYVVLKANFPVKALNTTSGDMLSFFFEDMIFQIDIKLKSTAKH